MNTLNVNKPEILDIVNDKDEIIGQASYEEVHKEKLLHRVTSAMLINDADEVLIQLRAKDKSAFPLHWSFSVGGHVRHRETYEKALVRESEEEAGFILLPDTLSLRGEGSYTDPLGHAVLYKTFQIHYDGPIESENEEVAAMQFVSWDIVRTMILEGKQKLQPEMVDMLKRHYAKELGL